MCSHICDGMRDMFRNLAYDVSALMKAAQDLEDEHALRHGQWQTTTKAASVWDMVPHPQDLCLRLFVIIYMKIKVTCYHYVVISH